jgi:hypothetical protein
MTVTARRSAPSWAGVSSDGDAGGRGDGGTAVVTFVPQFRQNLAWGGSSVWQLAQCNTNNDPQFMQNLAVFGFSVWQLGQFMSISAFD